MAEVNGSSDAKTIPTDQDPRQDKAQGRELAPETDIPPRQASRSAVGLFPGLEPAPAAPTLTGKPPDFIRQYELVDRIRSYDPEVDEALLDRAYVFAMRAHGDQKRSSGDPYISHPLAVASILTELKLDQETIATALLHDVVEDTPVTIGEITDIFGPVIAELVDGVTKISKRELAPDADGKTENFAKFLLATAKDLRVLIVKLADRLHNMRTLHFVPSTEKRARIARETMDIYAPMAGRIGMQAVKEELEDLSFRYLYPEAFDRITDRLDLLSQRAGPHIVRLATRLRESLAEAGMVAEVYAREKRVYSIWRKMQRKGSTFEELADIYAFRVIVEDGDACYRALGIIHQAFKMIPGEFDDYVSTPKPNGYRSIHTAVLASSEDSEAGTRYEGQRVEIQIRTFEMHEVAERGIAAHWRYKASQNDGGRAGGPEAGKDDPYLWLRGMIETLATEGGKDLLLAQAKLDLYHDQIFPFTPKGRVIPLPTDGTVLDFAYGLHTELGDRCAGAKVNGALRPPRSRLRTGDVVEILTNENAPIPQAWESFVVSAAAKTGLRRRARALNKRDKIILGERVVAAAFAARHLPFSSRAVEGVVAKLGFDQVDALYEAAGEMTLPARQVVEAVYPDLDADTDQHTGEGRLVETGAPLPRRAVSIAGMTPGGAITLGLCCGPLPGQRIIGLRDGENDSITVHTIDCERLADRQEEEWIDLAWSDSLTDTFIVPIVLTVNNKTGALGDIGTLLGRYGADILDINVEKRDVDFTDLCLDISVRDVRHLQSVLTGLRVSDYVVSAEKTESREEGPYDRR